MALFEKRKQLPVDQVLQLRQQGLTDDIVIEELSRQGFPQEQISQAIAQADKAAMPMEQEMPAYSQPSFGSSPAAEVPSASPPDDLGNIYERMEEIAESLIDEKWDALIVEVKKIIEWKSKVEEKQNKMLSDIEKLKGDFKILHEGVLGKLEDYDTRMQDVGTELKAVGKVFKDVIPEFVDNVKELSSLKNELRGKR